MRPLHKGLEKNIAQLMLYFRNRKVPRRYLHFPSPFVSVGLLLGLPRKFTELFTDTLWLVRTRPKDADANPILSLEDTIIEG